MRKHSRRAFGPGATPTRRSVVGASLAVAGTTVLAACSDGSGGTGGGHAGHGGGTGTQKSGGGAKPAGGFVAPDGPEVQAAEARRKGGRERKVTFTAVASPLELGGGRTVRTWSYGDRLPGQEVRATAGETLALTLANNLPAATSLHWHGLALRNDMDGVPGLTQRPIAPGAEFTYRFALAHPGTYWFHPHSGVQQERGLYAPLIIEDPKEPLAYDKEWTVVLDDWVDGVDGSTPDAVLAELRKGMTGGGHEGHGMTADQGTVKDDAVRETESPSPSGGGPSRMMMGARSALLGGDAGDVAYPLYLVNGRTPDDPAAFAAKPGDRIRLRIVNAGGDTAFRVALGGHQLTVTHTDGFPVTPTTTDALLVGMGERYDVLVTAGDGVFPLVAVAEGKRASALALLRTGGGAAPAPSVQPRELSRRILTADRLTAHASVALARREPDRTIEIELTGSMAKYDWAFDGVPYSPAPRHEVRAGERVRLVFRNPTAMWHPIHLHGHTFALAGAGAGGARKDTAVILPNGTLTVDFEADNPGLWMIHCHNVYHAEAGMMTVLGYLK
ncbi:multicopper oxidase family protein [Streptomyces sp. NPDC057638]|uniref:multicopper oxidase family protein n=1 Tax=Streptomyces sp. NPDC057638 TaxID=3346190 RepID=UPI0036B729B1